PYALVEKHISGNRARLEYERGAIDLTLGADGTIAMAFDSLPPDVKTIRLAMLIPFNFSDGGTWKAGAGGEQSFPSQPPAQPYLFQGNVDRFAFQNGEGR